MDERRKSYALRLTLAMAQGDRALQDQIIEECIEDVMAQLMTIPRRYDITDLPFIVAAMQLSGTALRSMLSDSGRSLADTIVQNSSCITINAGELRRQSQKLEDEPEEADK